MPSPRNSPKSSRERRAPGSRLEFLSLTSQRSSAPPESPSHRKESTASAGPPQALPEEDCMKLNPSFVGIALRSLLAVDLWASKQLGVCAGENSPWGSARPLMKAVEISGHGIPWLAGTLYGLCRSASSAGREVLLNLLFALILDLFLVAAVKGLVKRRRPAHNKMDMFATVSVDSGRPDACEKNGELEMSTTALCPPVVPSSSIYDAHCTLTLFGCNSPCSLGIRL
uniref:phospholipid phosphatase 6 isoform X2 n=1 Tax=Podarcis muralis TaxID=64176 RepID=UPI00109F19A8|nr:phospholipid phosphatase 6 isoform X2 [Podarcis muralis]